MRAVVQVAAKELRETLRDRRTLLIMIVLPVFLYPVMFIAIQQLTLFGQRQLEQKAARVVVVGAAEPLRDFLQRDTTLRLLEADHPQIRLVDGEVDALVTLASGAGEGTTRAVVSFDATRERSRYARERLRIRLASWSDTVLARRLEAQGLPADFATPVAVTDTSVATAAQAGGYALGRFLPVILVMMTLLSAFYPAIDLAAGEKERGTLETLLTTPVPAHHIVGGKFLAVTLIAVAAAALNLLSMLLTMQSGLFQFAQAGALEFTLPLSTTLLVLLLLVPLAVLFGSLFLGFAVQSQSFKEAQNALTPVQLLSLLPAFLPLLPGIAFTPALALVPVGGLALLIRELMSGTAAWLPSLLVVASTVAYAGAALAFAARRFGSEDVLFGSRGEAPRSLVSSLREWRRSDQGVPRPATAMVFVAGVAGLYFYLGAALQVALGLDLQTGTLVMQWLLLGVPALLLAWAGPYDFRRTLALRPISVRTSLAALLLASGSLPVAMLIGWVQTLVLPIPEEFLGAFAELFEGVGTARILWLLLVVAVTPAICEELVFRGVLLQGLLRQGPPWRAVLLSAVVFGAFHLSFYTVVRFLPTMWTGLVLGYAVWRSGSLWTGLLIHLVTNGGLVLLFVADPAWGSVLATPEGRPRWPALLVAPLALGLGAWLLRRSSHPSNPTGA